MKKLIVFLTVITLFTNNSIQAADSGRGVAQNSKANSNTFGWGLALGGFVIIGLVAGIVASTASTSNPNYSH